MQLRLDKSAAAANCGLQWLGDTGGFAVIIKQLNPRPGLHLAQSQEYGGEDFEHGDHAPAKAPLILHRLGCGSINQNLVFRIGNGVCPSSKQLFVLRLVAALPLLIGGGVALANGLAAT